jgi:hypothetical protein
MPEIYRRDVEMEEEDEERMVWMGLQEEAEEVGEEELWQTRGREKASQSLLLHTVGNTLRDNEGHTDLDQYGNSGFVMERMRNVVEEDEGMSDAKQPQSSAHGAAAYNNTTESTGVFADPAGMNDGAAASGWRRWSGQGSRLRPHAPEGAFMSEKERAYEEKIKVLLDACPGLSEETAQQLLLHTGDLFFAILSMHPLYLAPTQNAQGHKCTQQCVAIFLYVAIHTRSCVPLSPGPGRTGTSLATHHTSRYL